MRGHLVELPGAGPAAGSTVERAAAPHREPLAHGVAVEVGRENAWQSADGSRTMGSNAAGAINRSHRRGVARHALGEESSEAGDDGDATPPRLPLPPSMVRTLWAIVLLLLSLSLLLLVGGIVANSVALLHEAMRVGIGMACQLALSVLARAHVPFWPADAVYTFGWRRVTPIGRFCAVLSTWSFSLWIVLEAMSRTWAFGECAAAAAGQPRSPPLPSPATPREVTDALGAVDVCRGVQASDMLLTAISCCCCGTMAAALLLYARGGQGGVHYDPHCASSSSSSSSSSTRRRGTRRAIAFDQNAPEVSDADQDAEDEGDDGAGPFSRGAPAAQWAAMAGGMLHVRCTLLLLGTSFLLWAGNTVLYGTSVSGRSALNVLDPLCAIVSAAASLSHTTRAFAEESFQVLMEGANAQRGAPMSAGTSRTNSSSSQALSQREGAVGGDDGGGGASPAGAVPPLRYVLARALRGVDSVVGVEDLHVWCLHGVDDRGSGLCPSSGPGPQNGDDGGGGGTIAASSGVFLTAHLLVRPSASSAVQRVNAVVAEATALVRGLGVEGSTFEVRFVD